MHDYEFRPDHDAQFLAPVLPETVAMYWVTSRVPHNSTDVALRYLYLGNFSGCVPIFIIPVNFFFKKVNFQGLLYNIFSTKNFTDHIFCRKCSNFYVCATLCHDSLSASHLLVSSLSFPSNKLSRPSSVAMWRPRTCLGDDNNCIITLMLVVGQ